ncbi:MAG: FAD-binding domain-containing protein [Roseiflexaceae bacterium]
MSIEPSQQPPHDLRRAFADRAELIAYLREVFPEAAAQDDHVSSTVGGRAAAEQQLAQLRPRQYAETRNFLDGAVTRLSAYIRHGVLSLAEVRDAALAAVRRPQEASKLIQELAWRDYWQRLYAQYGEKITQNQEPLKTGYSPRQYAERLPDDIANGTTGLACIDALSTELRETGYLHNHARMWLAAYIVHWRRVRWQAGARWFLEHLLDGDPASNYLSWQWVASSFSHKPYFFNRENLERYTNGRYCRDCPLAKNGTCPFDASYEELQQELFPHASLDLNRDRGQRRR